MDDPRSTSEKRKFPRFRSYNVIRVVGPRGREIQQDSAVVNISEGGLLFYSVEDVEPESIIKVHIEIPEFNCSITVGARVMWVQKAMEQPNCYFVGTKFIDLRDADRELIRKLHGKSEIPKSS